MSPGTLHPELSTSAVAHCEHDAPVAAERLEAEPLCAVCFEIALAP